MRESKKFQKSINNVLKNTFVTSVGEMTEVHGAANWDNDAVLVLAGNPL